MGIQPGSKLYKVFKVTLTLSLVLLFLASLCLNVTSFVDLAINAHPDKPNFYSNGARFYKVIGTLGAFLQSIMNLFFSLIILMTYYFTESMSYNAGGSNTLKSRRLTKRSNYMIKSIDKIDKQSYKKVRNNDEQEDNSSYLCVT